ncbi:hypothetical protein GCK72_022413 [Caenorhabditis remanei]|uniref:Clathrin/coatomer adaptor adaptin-like N-terminal domain-containing protein n=1 Tax=Caenorhabditis remanei TaxID=31234 RepID=A0A6A5FTZ3_CAERE|nr:hypothetical protein GCK72_022413 [Caenorhabditis remanei]KAF1745965.1 hypothetical protein GCK72_022413 [Caenorhabditis remanei]
MDYTERVMYVFQDTDVLFFSMVTHEYPNHCGKSYCLIDTLDSIPYFDIHKRLSIQDVTVRVESIRHFSVSQMALLVENAYVLLAGSAQQRSNMCEVLLAVAWICGEYSQHVRNQRGVLESMLKTKPSVMPGHILSVYVQNIGKLYCSLMSQAEEEVDALKTSPIRALRAFGSSGKSV